MCGRVHMQLQASPKKACMLFYSTEVFPEKGRLYVHLTNPTECTHGEALKKSSE